MYIDLRHTYGADMVVIDRRNGNPSRGPMVRLLT